MKKRILFATAPLACGGVEKSLLSILEILPQEKFDVTLLLTEKSGDLLPCVPYWVNVEEIPLAPLDRYEWKNGRVPTLKYAVVHFHWLHAFKMLILRLRWILSGRKGCYNLMVAKAMMARADRSRMSSKFDFAFAYGGGILPAVAVRMLVSASVTGIWCHGESEIEFLKSGLWRELHSQFTYRFATKQMCERLNEGISPDMPLFTEVPYFLDKTLAECLANDGVGFVDDFDGLRVLTVGRLSCQKGIDVAIEIAARLKSEGIKFRWYVVGGGEDEEKLSLLISKNGVDDCFKLLGQHINPYPFFRMCDVYAQPSRWEAYCITVAEARMFNKPIVCTDFIGAREQLVNEKTGLIVPLNDVDGFYNNLKRLLLDVMLRERLSYGLSLELPDSTIEALATWKELLNSTY